MVFKKLLCLICLTIIISDQVLGEPLTLSEQQKIVERFNDRRKELAVEKNITNFWKLEWDGGLAKLAGQIATSWDPKDPKSLRNGDYYRVFLSHIKTIEEDDRTENIELSEASAFHIFFHSGPYQVTREHLTTKSDFQFSSIEAVQHMQRSIGCVRQDIEVLGLDFQCICVVGPYGWQHLKTQKIIHGEPGSKCGPDGIKEGDMCVLKKPKKGSDDDDDDDEDSDDEESGKKKKEFDLNLNSVRQDQGTFLAAVLVSVIFLIE